MNQGSTLKDLGFRVHSSECEALVGPKPYTLKPKKPLNLEPPNPKRP